jgi:ComF family protein
VGQLKPVPPPWCASCGRPIQAGDYCPACRRARLPLAAVRSAALFAGPLRPAIHRLKYRGRRSAARALSDLLVAPACALRTTWPAPDGTSIGPSAGPSAARTAVVIPVPLHPTRERERGYNQAALLARPLALALGWPLDAHALRRVKDTAPLVRMSEAERAAAVAGAFAATRSLEGRHVLLVDDVATTCSTLAAAARACQAAGAASVAALTLAREQKRHG